MTQKILIVETNPTMILSIKNILKSNGFASDFTEDGRDAIELAQKISYQLAIIDFMIPYANGFETAQQILQVRKDIKVLVLTDIPDWWLFKFHSAQNPQIPHLKKPFEPEALLEKIRSFFPSEVVSEE